MLPASISRTTNEQVIDAASTREMAQCGARLTRQKAERLTTAQAAPAAQKKPGETMTPNLNRARPTPAATRPFRTLSALLAAAALTGAAIASHSAHAGEIPTFTVDAPSPKPLPNNGILGQVGGITVARQGHVWVIHRPCSLTDDEFHWIHAMAIDAKGSVNTAEVDTGKWIQKFKPTSDALR
jgi:hypothetical protein